MTTLLTINQPAASEIAKGDIVELLGDSDHTTYEVITINPVSNEAIMVYAELPITGAYSMPIAQLALVSRPAVVSF